MKMCKSYTSAWWFIKTKNTNIPPKGDSYHSSHSLFLIGATDIILATSGAYDYVDDAPYVDVPMGDDLADIHIEIPSDLSAATPNQSINNLYD